MTRAFARVAIAWAIGASAVTIAAGAAPSAAAESADAAPSQIEKDGGPLDGGAGGDWMGEARALVAEWSGAPYARRGAITDAVVAMDDHAVPALIVAKRTAASYGTRAWAAATLEAMGKERADAQIRARSDDVLAAILRAFGEARDPDALSVVTAFLDSDRATPRDAARDALGDYGDDALGKLRQDYANIAGKAAPRAWDAPRIARELYTAFDHARLREVYALLDEGLARLSANDVAGAVSDFDRVLARAPDLDRRDEVIGAYVDRAIALEETDALGARVTLEKARRIDASSAREGAIAGELAYLDARDLEARGAPAPDAYRRALALDPANPRARTALDRLDALAAARAARVRRWRIAAGSIALLVVLCVLFVGRRTRS